MANLVHSDCEIDDCTCAIQGACTVCTVRSPICGTVATNPCTYVYPNPTPFTTTPMAWVNGGYNHNCGPGVNGNFWYSFQGSVIPQNQMVMNQVGYSRAGELKITFYSTAACTFYYELWRVIDFRLKTRTVPYPKYYNDCYGGLTECPTACGQSDTNNNTITYIIELLETQTFSVAATQQKILTYNPTCQTFVSPRCSLTSSPSDWILRFSTYPIHSVNNSVTASAWMGNTRIAQSSYV